MQLVDGFASWPRKEKLAVAKILEEEKVKQENLEGSNS